MKRIHYLLALGTFGIGTTEFGVIGILPQIAAAFSVTIEKAGQLLSLFALIVAVSGPFVMLLMSSVNRKKLMLFVLGIFAISNLLSVFATSFNMLLIARILPAFLHPVFWSIALSIAANSLYGETSSKGVAIVFGGFTVSSVIGIPLATLMASVFNWQSSFVLCAVINILSFVGILFFLPSIKIAEKQTVSSQTKILKKPILWISFTLSFLMIAAMFSTYGFMAVFLARVTKMNGTQISWMLLIFGLSGVAGNWLAGFLLNKSILKTAFMFIIALMLIHLLLYCYGLYFVPMILLIAIWGFVHTAGFLISNVNLTSSAPESPEFVNSIFTTCGNAGVTFGTILGGYFISGFSVQNVIWSSIGLLIMALLVWILKRFGNFE
ncbi:MFS transporter [Flavobacterium pectinovorum]|uniref:MFS transporter n=1 Tax=Flavobacterium pectinovorum TaxID=29533 RepID=A0A502E8T4_9FLAO|nr:MFS transporter [Flavobacterium pectinovorum]TPG34033.1 MFS transporter [Flavobacterium pectinovorum]